MTIASMTGFARADGASAGLSWYWEVRSVNARGLDIRTRVAAGFERFEPALRDRLQKRLARGSLNISLGVRREASSSGLRINAAALEAVLEACETLRGRGGVREPSADGLLAIKGVLEIEEAEPEADETRDAAMLASFDEALEALIGMRREEGGRLAPALSSQLARLAELADEADALPSRAPEEIRRKLSAQIEQVTANSAAFDTDRLHQEAVLLATKADIQEEIDRLRAHVAAAEALLSSGDAVGRRLDFLTQELNREANTICSKSNDIALTRIGLAMKSAVDQLREQVQNVE